MPLQTTESDLKLLINNFTYKQNGDKYEIEYGHLIIDYFPKSEIYWKTFVTPITKRIEPSIANNSDSIRRRSNISDDLFDLCITHYSVFLNLAYAGNSISNKHLSYFENFYTHLGSVCDLAEEFITQLYFITLKCEEKETEILQRLSKSKFVDLAKDWFDKYYSTTFEHYLRKGKTAPFKILGRSNILEEYFAKAIQWKEYCKVASEIRTFRNVIVHNSQIGSHISPNGSIFVPKKSKIGEYKKLHQVFSVNQDRFKRDFIDRDLQMKEDFILLKTMLNNLWEFPIKHFNRLLYEEKNKLLMTKYNMLLI